MNMMTNHFTQLEDVHHLTGKCVRCNVCKFVPLAAVERQEFSSSCPSYDEFKAHFHSGGGKAVITNSLLDGRSEITEAVRQAVYRCNACGGCDLSCKWNSDIELQETILLLRARVFEKTGPLPEHAKILESLRRHDHPLTDADATPGAWRQAVRPNPAAGGPLLLWLGSSLTLRRRNWPHLSAVFRLLDEGGVRYRLLAEEPCVGRAALEIGDRALFIGKTTRAAQAINESGAKRVVCLAHEDYATLRNATPRHVRVKPEILHLADLYDELIAAGKLVPKLANPLVAGWHDAPWLGRLADPFVSWRGVEKKVYGQMIVTDPPRPISYGTNGCYESPRRVLAALPGVVTREFHRRREYAYDCGETGQVRAAYPEFARHTAERRLREARSSGFDTVVVEHPDTRELLAEAAARHIDLNVRITTLTDLLTYACFGLAARKTP